MKITAFLPCRKGSERVPKKNIRRFGPFKHGLIEIKLHQLLSVNEIDNIVLSTNDDEIIEYAHQIKNKKLSIHKRADTLATSETSTDSLVEHALGLIPEGHILWTHVTSPFLDAETYRKIINKYKSVVGEGFDSLMTTNLIHGFLWGETGPINYSRDDEKWPRTQTIKPVHEINSGVFLSSTENYKKYEDRIGQQPFLYTLDKIRGFDIDWEDDFKMAECLYQVRSSEE